MSKVNKLNFEGQQYSTPGTNHPELKVLKDNCSAHTGISSIILL